MILVEQFEQAGGEIRCPRSTLLHQPGKFTLRLGHQEMEVFADHIGAPIVQDAMKHLMSLTCIMEVEIR